MEEVLAALLEVLHVLLPQLLRRWLLQRRLLQ